MLKRLLVLAGAFFALSAPAMASGPAIFVENHSTVVSEAELADDLPAFQRMVDLELGPIWGVNATLIAGEAPPGAWKITINDTPACFNCLGYHDVDSNGIPFGDVGAQLSKEYNGLWEVTFTHELQELLVDPWVNRAILGARIGATPARWWLNEVSDPPEDDSFAYWRPSATGRLIPISDFITPAWYGNRGKGPYDFNRKIRKPLQILKGGYACYMAAGRWQCIDKFGRIDKEETEEHNAG